MKTTKLVSLCLKQTRLLSLPLSAVSRASDTRVAGAYTVTLAMEEEGKVEADDAAKAVDDYALLLASTREKMRLTVEWRGEAQTEKEIMVATARRVGLEIADTAPSRE